ncbi:MAG: nucleotidyltransferase family protein [Bacteroidota bacterium]|nr:nucleotidyltransferase family protein [Bacteroidota bacterium]
MISQETIQIIQQILAPFEPKRIGIFGSVVRGEATSESDLDILVEFKKKYSLFDLVDLEDKLAEALHYKIDLITERSLHPRLKQYIDKEVIFLE